ncbi:phage baseplate assembly protein V [Marinomonas mediterranea]|jgi:phage baseplate assembly protein V|uniref:Phage baseplate assembly protein V n=1 Tax=Marinomonas mediterranea (strain ATCC 700492 / JCM 21426 / NBRC 103028 / MMB-1) TaxID=717774 RepID=F2K1R7_MARM1|nr:phage baseplate assembly protein V [Marinomonas mediterranea]ADZ93401.1 phage baseplate assembly protein V [Marinomonas mediterranea MMB-1]WCN11289.1 phage baseplate assembly protein V [Marinomonas mediterranea]WCN15354.1 phage baseplate assembly protein V [Marinomonas mediterranea]WCN19395.1 phage baseplate assembly protein V [Marinomonas mediterranea MMB-1]
MKYEQALIECGTVIEAQEDQALVKVHILGRETDWLPILQQANAFKRHYTPPRIGQQVVILMGRYVLGSIFNKTCREPEATTTEDVTVYEDGTEIRYDSQTHTLTLKAMDVLKIETNQSVSIATESATVTASTVTVEANEVQLNGGSGDVVVNGISLVNHTHPQNAGNHFGGGASTGAAQ